MRRNLSAFTRGLSLYPSNSPTARAGRATTTPKSDSEWIFPAAMKSARAPMFDNANTVFKVDRKTSGDRPRACIRKTKGGPLVDVDVASAPLVIPRTQSATRPPSVNVKPRANDTVASSTTTPSAIRKADSETATKMTRPMGMPT